MESKCIMIGTPTIDGKVDVSYVDSLKDTILEGLKLNINIVPIFIAYDSLLCRARNDLFAMAYYSDVSDLIFIDADTGWKTDDFFKLCNHNVHFVASAIRKKTDLTEDYNIKAVQKNNELILNVNSNDLMKVLGVGSGFLRLDNYAIKKIWDNSEKYIENEKEKRAIFNITYNEGILKSEDISLCELWRNLDENVFVDVSINCVHIGVKSYYSNLKNFITS